MHANISALLTQSCVSETIAQANGTAVAPGTRIKVSSTGGHYCGRCLGIVYVCGVVWLVNSGFVMGLSGMK